MATKSGSKSRNKKSSEQEAYEDIAKALKENPNPFSLAGRGNVPATGTSPQRVIIRKSEGTGGEAGRRRRQASVGVSSSSRQRTHKRGPKNRGR